MALKDVFRTALTGRCDARPELAQAPHPAESCACRRVPCRGGADLLRRLFEPLGWQVEATPVPARPGRPRVGRLALPRRPADRRPPARRCAQPPVRAAARAGRREALLGQHRRGRQADPRGRRLARGPPGEGAHHPPVPVPPAGAGRRRAGPAGRGRRHRGRAELDNAVEERPALAARTCPVPWPSSGAARSSPRCARRARARSGDLGCGDGALLPGSARRTRHSNRSSRSTSRRGRCSSPGGGCAWTG